ncbi:RodZ domain-containing protein [Roseateles sp. BYS180W]|uniref:RodZ domain-containing protein n=1 Tax=Roseateles rivi TaxID=3299028 RepID=A0ABW7FVU6_9BURK
MTSMPAADAAAVDAASAGAALRQAREARGLHLAALAVMLKVPQAKLEALEADRYDQLPDATFTRALARAVCRALKLEAEPVLALLPRGAEPLANGVSTGLNQPFRERFGRQEIGASAWFRHPLVWAAGGVMVAAVLVLATPSPWFSGWGGSRDGAAQAPSAASDVASAVMLGALAEAPAASAVLNAPPPALVQPAAASAPQVAPASQAAAVPAIAPEQAPQASAAVPAGAQPLLVKVTAESWIEVVDARQQVLLSKLLRPGQQVELQGQPPLRLRVGNVTGTEIRFRGAVVDLSGSALNNVARLELN